MTRIAIIGNSGSGKSTLARELLPGQADNILDLDTIAWQKNAPTQRRPVSHAAEDVRTFCHARSAWVVEGCYAELISAALVFGPELIFLDPGVQVCLANCKRRPWEPHKYPSKSAQDQHLEFSLEWVKAYYTREGDLSFSAHAQLYEQYPGPKRIQTKTHPPPE